MDEKRTEPCHDCGTTLTAPFSYVRPITGEEKLREQAGEFVLRPPLCQPCWKKRVGEKQ